MANYDYEIVNGRKIRVRPKETVSEIDKKRLFPQTAESLHDSVRRR